MASGRQRLGFAREKEALRFLKRKGFRLLQANFRTRFGEIDLVMADGECVVFVEVRYRTRSDYSSAVESVDAGKRRRLVLAAQYYLARHPRMAERPMRFDVVAFDADASGDRCRWIRDAFRPDD